MIQRNNVTIEDIKEIEKKIGIELSEEKREEILNQYNKIVGDRAEDWDKILEWEIVDWTEEGLKWREQQSGIDIQKWYKSINDANDTK